MNDDVERWTVTLGTVGDHPLTAEVVLASEYDAMVKRAEKAEAQVLAIAQKFDEEHPDPALMARIIMKNVENGLRADEAEAERDAAYEDGQQDMQQRMSLRFGLLCKQLQEAGYTEFADRAQTMFDSTCRVEIKEKP
jgi:hypothetical protein